MSEQKSQFRFEFSLEILNHLWRWLYRSFATVVSEAVSNSWDAEARKVEITINSDQLIVDDNWKWMDTDDFQERFLKVGYSRRLDKNNLSKRNVIGRKWIGKLAMLSISNKVTILSKKDSSEIIWGKINNIELDVKIKNDWNYNLEELLDTDIQKLFTKEKTKWTKIIFEWIRTKLNSEDILRKYLATQFNFIFSLQKNDSFDIFVNWKQITENDLKELDENTQFIWFLGSLDNKRLDRYNNLKEFKIINDNTFEFEGKKIEIKGFIASVIEPKHLLLRGSDGDFKASINLFCNWRLRQESLFEEITSKQLPEEYLYWEVHVDGFEDEENDRFTSSREWIIKDDPLYQKFLEQLKIIQKIVLNEWNILRRKYRYEADINNGDKPKYQLRLEDSKNWREKDFEEKIDKDIEDAGLKNSLKEKLRNLSNKNTLIYQDLFILENIFREYIKIKNINEKDFNINNNDEKLIIDTIKATRKSRKEWEERHSLKDKIVKEEHYLNYVDLFYLGEIIDILVHKIYIKEPKRKYRKGLESDTKDIEPIRNPIMHTNEITEDVLSWNKINNVINFIEKLSDKIN